MWSMAKYTDLRFGRRFYGTGSGYREVMFSSDYGLAIQVQYTDDRYENKK
jgi:hypothetical protein